MIKSKKILISLSFIVFSFAVGILTVKNLSFQKYLNSDPEVLSAEQINEAYLDVDFGNGRVETFSSEINSGDSAFFILEKFSEERGVDINYEQYDFGVFIKGIGETEGDNSKAWLYSVNGENANVSADNYKLNAGDMVRFEYKEFDTTGL